ncbi:uncharacterized protein [Temnothorax longispinosus]|uniref:uncharacterized protein n=1 Tax=Temnothorax longispinosus TaxID=300112 RepID=UPI003A9955FD
MQVNSQPSGNACIFHTTRCIVLRKAYKNYSLLLPIHKQLSKKKIVKLFMVEELEAAELNIVRVIQLEVFQEETQRLKNERSFKGDSRLKALDPFLDEKKLIRVGGRLRQAQLPEETRHPIVLPAKHKVTRLIFRAMHKKLHHCGTEQLLATVRQRYWVLSGRREARKVTCWCLNCFRLRPPNIQVKMGDLPEERITGYLRPFAISGVDYAGPIMIRKSRRRGRVHTSNAYIALFICFSTKAIHIELVTDMTTEAFLAALQRFINRRGICSSLYSDNGTNFVGASRELQELYNFVKNNGAAIQDQLARQKIVWNFIPPRAPNFGGLWEAAVKSTKRHFYAVTKGLTLDLRGMLHVISGS